MDWSRKCWEANGLLLFSSPNANVSNATYSWQGWAILYPSFSKSKHELVRVSGKLSLRLHRLLFPFTSFGYFSINCPAFAWKQPKMIRNVVLSVKFWQFDTFLYFFSITRAKNRCMLLKTLMSEFHLNSVILFLFFRFGKHKKDDGREDRIERKGSSKSKLGDVRAAEEETMRLEHERWGVLDSAMETPLTGTSANHPISQMVKQGWSSLWKHSDVNLWTALFYNYTLQRSLIDCSCRYHSEALTS